MSILTRCNFCVLEGLMAHAANTGGKVVLEPGDGELQGIDASIIYPNQTKAWAAWFWEISDHCVCDD